MEKLKLYCFPYAGGSSAVYMKWRSYLDSSIEIIPIELAGRGRRFSESFYNNMEELVADVFNVIEKDIRSCGMYAFFGHSLGGLIAYELAHKINEQNVQMPKHIFFSGCKPPHKRNEGFEFYELPDEEFKRKIFNLGGTPKELLENQELMQMFLPILRSDFKINETYKYSEKHRKLVCDITILSGKEDEMTMDDVNEWKMHTESRCEFYTFNGGHFFINEKMEEIISIINKLV